MKKFLSCEQGNFAITFAVALMPILASVGVAIDYTRAVTVRSFVQDQADAAAISAAHDGMGGDFSPYAAYMRTAITDRYGPGKWIDQLNVAGDWLTPSDFQISATGQVPVTFLAAIPGFRKSIGINVRAIVRVADPRFIYGPPTMSQLDPDAADYNRITIYCFDPQNKDDRKTHGRTQMTVIADNAGTKYKYTMPQCDAGQFLSYKLMNVRNARTTPKKWDKGGERYEYYTDTTIVRGTEKYDLGNADILETVLCDNAAQCQPKSKGGILPEGANRTPQRATKSCSPGKYMYYGWEDRPPGGGSDRDYNDIRIVIGCPTIEQVGARSLRLVG